MNDTNTISTGLIDDITHAETLDALCEALNVAQSALDDAESDLKLDDLVDTSSLPAFGGPPSYTIGAYSWDATRVLISGNTQPGYPIGGWALVSRDEVAS